MSETQGTAQTPAGDPTDGQGTGNTGTTTEGQQNPPQTPGDTGSEWKAPASQEEFNRIIQGRVAQVERKYADYPTLKSKVEGMDKALADARKEGAAEVTTQFTRRLLNSEVKAQATALGFHDPADALTALNDTDSLVKDDGEIDTDKLSASLTDLATRKPYLVAGNTPPPPARRPGPRRPSENPSDTPPEKGKGRAANLMRQFAGGQ